MTGLSEAVGSSIAKDGLDLIATVATPGVSLARPTWASFFHLDSSSINLLAVELANGLLGSALLCHLDEGKAPGPTRIAVYDEVCRDDIPDLSKQL
jgi:hypothetical protein